MGGCFGVWGLLACLPEEGEGRSEEGCEGGMKGGSEEGWKE